MKPIIDISYYQQPSVIDYDKLSNEVSGVILRAGYGTGVPGKWQGRDTTFERHYAEFTKRGVPLGAYHFITEYQPMNEQVKVFIDAVKGKKLKLGYWCDVEYELGAERLTAKSVIGWMDGVEAVMGECGVYAANWCWRSIMGVEYARYANRKLWCAAYTKEVIIPPGWDGNWYLWQYTSSGRLNGYGGNLDMNKFGGSDAEFQAWIGGNNVLLNIPPLAQRDPKWKDIQLGTSSVTIGGYGCLITCASMMCRYFGIDIDPAGMNAWLKANNGYQNSNWFVWGSLNKLDPRISFGYRYQYAALDKIDAELAAGRPVIINVDMVPGTPVMDEHWVLVVGKVDGSYIINDPWYGTQGKFEDRYGSPSKGIYIVSTYKFTGTPAPVPPDEPEPLPEGKTRTLVNLNIRKGAGTSYARWATAPKGTILDILETQGDWVRVGWNQWCMSKYNGVRYIE